MAIVSHASRGEWTVVSSDAIEYEVQQCPDLKRRRTAHKLASTARVLVTIERKHYERAEDLARLGFGQLDALHIAAAESARCDAMLSTDDRLLKKAIRYSKSLHVSVENPLNWLLEQSDAHNTDDPR